MMTKMNKLTHKNTGTQHLKIVILMTNINLEWILKYQVRHNHPLIIITKLVRWKEKKIVTDVRINISMHNGKAAA